MRCMSLRVLTRESRLPFPAHMVWDWHLRPGALERLLPPWSGVEVAHRHGSVGTGGRVELRVPAFGRNFTWVARHEIVEPGIAFADIQEKGPFLSWRHTHRVRPDGAGCILEDQVEFAPPWGALGRAAMGSRVERELDALVAWRQQRLSDDLGRHALYAAMPRLTIAISGSTGLLGRQLSAFLTTGGHRVIPLVRGGGVGIDWDPGRSIDVKALGECDALIHLAGENVAGQRWNADFKSRLWSSRVEATQHLCAALAAAPQRPPILICASGTGIYGLHRLEAVKEDSSPGDDFLARLCVAWEEACDPARHAGMRVVNLRLGAVFSGQGGALQKLLPPVRWGVAGPIAGGKQRMPWIALDDALGVLHHALFAEHLHGPINAVSPEIITNAGLIRALGRRLHRPTILPLPAWAVRLAFGEMGEATILADSHVVPGRLLAEDFPWRYRRLDDCLRFEVR